MPKIPMPMGNKIASAGGRGALYKSRAEKTYEDSASDDDGRDDETAAKPELTKVEALLQAQEEQQKQLELTKRHLDSERQKEALSKGADRELKPNPRFSSFSELF